MASMAHIWQGCAFGQSSPVSVLTGSPDLAELYTLERLGTRSCAVVASAPCACLMCARGVRAWRACDRDVAWVMWLCAVVYPGPAGARSDIFTHKRFLHQVHTHSMTHMCHARAHKAKNQKTAMHRSCTSSPNINRHMSVH